MFGFSIMNLLEILPKIPRDGLCIFIESNPGKG
jgi:hypothetical protein